MTPLQETPSLRYLCQSPRCYLLRIAGYGACLLLDDAAPCCWHFRKVLTFVFENSWFLRNTCRREVLLRSNYRSKTNVIRPSSALAKSILHRSSSGWSLLPCLRGHTTQPAVSAWRRADTFDGSVRRRGYRLFHSLAERQKGICAYTFYCFISTHAWCHTKFNNILLPWRYYVGPFCPALSFRIVLFYEFTFRIVVFTGAVL